MAKGNPRLQAALMEVVENQLRNLDPPETKETLDRLISQGISEQEARRLIGCVVMAEIFDILKQQKPFDRERFIAALNKLPKVPWEK